MKLNKRQLKRIIREERRRIIAEAQDHTVFSAEAIYDILQQEIEDYALNNGSPSETISSEEFVLIQQAVQDALALLADEFVTGEQ